MKKKRMVLVMAVSAMCMMAGCGNTVKDGTEALEQGDYDTGGNRTGRRKAGK